MRLVECTPGDVIVVAFDDGEERFAEVQSLLGGGRGKKKAPTSAMVRIADPETLRTYARVDRIADRTINMFQIGDREVELVRRSKHAKVSGDTEAILDRVGDDADPFLRQR